MIQITNIVIIIIIHNNKYYIVIVIITTATATKWNTLTKWCRSQLSSYKPHGGCGQSVAQQT